MEDECLSFIFFVIKLTNWSTVVHIHSNFTTNGSLAGIFFSCNDAKLVPIAFGGVNGTTVLAGGNKGTYIMVLI